MSADRGDDVEAWLNQQGDGRGPEANEGQSGSVEKPAKHTSSDWTEMYRLELGIEPTDRHQLLSAVIKDVAAAYHGDQAAQRRVAAYNRASRAFGRQVEAAEREAAAWAGEVAAENPEDDKDDAADVS